MNFLSLNFLVKSLQGNTSFSVETLPLLVLAMRPSPRHHIPHLRRNLQRPALPARLVLQPSGT